MMKPSSRGSKSSEKKAAYHATIIGFILAAYGIYKGVDLTGLGVLIGSVVLPLMVYGGFRTTVKVKHGEEAAQ